MVSIHAPARRATCARHVADARRKSQKFRSTPPHGGRRQIELTAFCTLAATFRSTPPHGGRPRALNAITAEVGATFRSTPPHGGRLAWRITTTGTGDCFDPRPRTGGDPIADPVSPHCTGTCFDPRPRTEGDGPPGTARLALVRPHVSIHAPARRATSVASRSLMPRITGFDPRPRTGGDGLWSGRFCQDRRGFDPRPRTEGDLVPQASAQNAGLPVQFRSTPPHGGRPLFQSAPVAFLLEVSIHAPARRATR